MGVLKNEVLNILNKPYRLFCIVALLLCVCTDVPEHCGDRYPALNPSTEVCGEDGRPQPKGGTAPSTYAVTVTGGAGATGSGSYAAGTTVKITAGTPPSGQVFKNWTTISSGVSLANANSASTSFTMPANTVTVTAVFEAIKYAVTVASAGTGKSGDGSYEAGETVTIKAGTPPTGQQFKNWTTTGAGVTLADANNATTTFTMPKNAVTATANFETPVVEPAKYTVVVNGGTEATGGGSYTAGTIVNITMGTPPSEQQFKNWTTTSAGVTFVDPNSASTSFTMPANAVTVKAVFEAMYTVTVSGGTGATGSGSYVAGAKVSITAGAAPAEQQFRDWTTSSKDVSFAEEYDAATTFTMPTHAVTVTANFEVIKYTVTFNGNGASNVPSAVSVNSGSSTTLPTMTRSGYTFGGWYEKSDGTGTGYTAGSSYTVTGNVILYAKWTLNSYTVTWNADGGAPVPMQISVNHGGSITAPAAMTKTGYTFIGWYTNDNFTTVATFPITNVTANISLYAKWLIIGTFTDDRDSKKYKTVKIGSQVWMAENLNYATTSGSWCYGDSPDSCGKYGMLYDWVTAMDISTSYNSTYWNGNDVNHRGVCPSGWHLPSRTECIALFQAQDFPAMTKLKSTSGWNDYQGTSGNGTDDYGFSALPGGLRDFDNDYPYTNVGSLGYWWTSTDNSSGFSTKAYAMIILNYSDYGQVNAWGKRMGFSVRCVQDD